MEQTVKERLIHFMKSKRLSQKRFEEACGLSNGYLNSLRKAPGLDKLQSIIYTFPELNQQWLLTGEGEMLNENSDTPATSDEKKIRYWVDINATGGGVELFSDQDTNRVINISIPEFKDCTDAVNIYGDSMSPLYKNGQIIILKKWTERFIDYGNVYLVITRNGNRMVKYIKQGSQQGKLLCVSENKDYDPFEIDLEDVLQLYIVKGSISKNTM